MRRPTILATLLLSLVLTACGGDKPAGPGGVGGAPGGDSDAEETHSADIILSDAEAAVDQLGSYRVSFNGSQGGQSIVLDAQVTARSAMKGSLTVNGKKGEFVYLGQRPYFKGAAMVQVLLQRDLPPAFADRWVTVTGVDLSFLDLFRDPASLRECVRSLTPNPTRDGFGTIDNRSMIMLKGLSNSSTTANDEIWVQRTVDHPADPHQLVKWSISSAASHNPDECSGANPNPDNRPGFAGDILFSDFDVPVTIDTPGGSVDLGNLDTSGSSGSGSTGVGPFGPGASPTP